MARRKVLVTGASGFIGRAVCGLLAAEGHLVRCGTRSGVLPAGFPAGLTVQPLDLDRPDQVRAAMAGVDAVVHAACGRVEAMAGQLATLLDAAGRADVPRIVHFSAIAVYGAATGRVDETRPPAPLDAYGRAKVACEQLLQHWTDDGRCVIALRPGIVYGPRSPLWNEKLARRIRAGAWGTFGRQGEGTAALVHVDDVARAVAAALECARAPGWRALNITGPQAPTWNAYFTAIADVLGVPLREIGPRAQRRARVLAVPAKAWRRLGLPGLERAALAPTAGEMALFARRATYPADLACAMLPGWRPQVADYQGELRRIHGRPAVADPVGNRDIGIA